MAIRSVVLRGYGNGTFAGTIPLVVTRGFAIGEAGATFVSFSRYRPQQAEGEAPYRPQQAGGESPYRPQRSPDSAAYRPRNPQLQ